MNFTPLPFLTILTPTTFIYLPNIFRNTPPFSQEFGPLQLSVHPTTFDDPPTISEILNPYTFVECQIHKSLVKGVKTLTLWEDHVSHVKL